MRTSKHSTFLHVFAVIAILSMFFPPSIFSSSAFTPQHGSLTGTASIWPKTLCSSLPNGDTPAGIYPTKGGAFVEDYVTGNIILCSAGSSKVIATAPLGGGANSWLSMGGIKTSTHGVVLVLSDSGSSGFWICYNATATGCSSESNFITLPTQFCSSLPYACYDVGVALDPSLNVYYVDPINSVLVECRASDNYQSCYVLPASLDLSGYYPWGLAIQGSTFYICDSSAAGLVWKGSFSSLTVIARLNTELDSIAVSRSNPGKVPEVYVGYTGFYIGAPAKIVDVTDNGTLPSPFTSSQDIFGLTSNLQFTATATGAVYQTYDPA